MVRKAGTICVECEALNYWVEFELVDEEGKPVGNMPYTLKAGGGQLRKGRSDSSGIIREKDLPPIPVRLTLTAQPLADEMEQRTLRLQRAEKDSTVKAAALQAGYEYRYLPIGQLCDQLPTLEPKWTEAAPPRAPLPGCGLFWF